MTKRGSSNLLVVHGFITLSAAIVLIVSPSLIPMSVGIHLDPSADLVSYLLAGAEIGLAVLSFGGSRLSDPRTLRLIVWSCIAFHGSSGILELYACIQGVSMMILVNIAVRVIVIAFFTFSLKGLRSDESCSEMKS